MIKECDHKPYRTFGMNGFQNRLKSAEETSSKMENISKGIIRNSSQRANELENMRDMLRHVELNEKI